jgi:hypothetical protein
VPIGRRQLFHDESLWVLVRYASPRSTVYRQEGVQRRQTHGFHPRTVLVSTFCLSIWSSVQATVRQFLAEKRWVASR